ncbi:hypothetical protein EC973_004512 [Apophysomyces ossiformis]|uniref:Uncharacterized protein n=1 Tax=Apophysomyces ossiformis TaxID=679940 RepID=A0A8H7BL81_9FUNG|nr:hypothetical protein EC973_004512 [Apophysomyces ossiformis]
MLNGKHLDKIYKHNGKYYMAQREMIQIARQLNLYVLAELCKLNCQQFLDGVGEALLQTLSLETTGTMRWIRAEITPVPLDSKEQFLASLPKPLPVRYTPFTERNGDDTDTGHGDGTDPWVRRLASRWKVHPSMILAKITLASKIRDQQRAIIKSRQHQAAVNHKRPRRELQNAQVVKVCLDYSPSSSVSPPWSVSEKSRRRIADKLHYPCKRKSKYQCTRNQEPPIMNRKASNNLELLATEATKMMNLPIPSE